MKLFMFCVGGACGGSNIELHDIRFALGETAEACHDEIRRQWWGTAASLHLDAWGAIEQADGYDIVVTDRADDGGVAQTLFFVHLGGYDPGTFGELHRNTFVVAKDAATAKRKGLAQVDWQESHKDKLIAVETALGLNGAAERYRLKLVPATGTRPFRFTSRYVPLG